jgi:transcriptional regulator with XRE-family HTH domain
MTMDVVASWTGKRADALRQALRMTNESFAGHLGVAVRTVAYWRQRPDVIPRPSMQEILDVALARAGDTARAQFALLISEHEHAQSFLTGTDSATATDIHGLTAWVTASNTSDEAIEHIDRAAVALADRHTQAPAGQLLGDVLELHGKAHVLLRSGRQRLRQTRDLIRIDGDLLAHASVLMGDLGQDRDADAHARAALLHLEEADASQATACYALAKSARWRQDYATAADLAERGYEPGPITPMGVQLASYEANSAALLGDHDRARQALTRAEQIAHALPGQEPSGSPWAFPPERLAIFRLSVLLRTGDPDGALRAAEAADEGWASGDPPIPGTWAQIRIGAAIAHLLKDSLDGATEQVTPMLGLAAEYRIATVTGWLADLDRNLAHPRFARNAQAESLRQQIRDFTIGALPSHTARRAG